MNEEIRRRHHYIVIITGATPWSGLAIDEEDAYAQACGNQRPNMTAGGYAHIARVQSLPRYQTGTFALRSDPV